MKLMVLENEEEIGLFIAKELVKIINKDENTVLGLATGSSPLPVYKQLVKMYKNNQVNFAKVRSFNLDEYFDVEDESKSYRVFMYENLFKDINIDLNNTHFPSKENVDTYDEMIKKAGGIDLQILGIGNNGHIAFNEPGTLFSSNTHFENLTESTRVANARFFNSLELVPKRAITMGLNSIMNSKQIFIIITGENKKEALSKLLSKVIDESFPASILNKHKNVTIFVDKHLYSLL